MNVGARQPLRVVCAREFQNSIEESVHKLLADWIQRDGLPYQVDKYRIYNRLGTEFIFKGLSKQDAAAVKSLEGADICWVEEAQNVSAASWNNLTPTIRKPGSKIIISFNPDTEDSPTYQRFVLKPPTNSVVQQVNYSDNPWFPAVLEQERLDMQVQDPKGYRNVWLGEPRTFAEGAYFRDEMEALDAAGRIGDVPVLPHKPVYVFWDMGHAASGKGDPHALTFVQQGDGEGYRIVDYWEGNNISLPKVLTEVLRAKPYTYGKMVMPHDARRVNSHTGKTDAQIVEEGGFSVETQERTADLDRDVNNIRLTLPLCMIDRERCGGLVAALKNHRQEKDEKTGIWRFRHDWTSHGVSSFRYFSVFQNDGGFATHNMNWRKGQTNSPWTR